MPAPSSPSRPARPRHAVKRLLLPASLLAAFLPSLVHAEASRAWRFDLRSREAEAGSVRVSPRTTYATTPGYGWLEGRDSVFAIRLPEGNYDVTVRYRDLEAARSATVRAESRRWMLVPQAHADLRVRRFTVNVRRPDIEGDKRVRLRRPEDASSPCWDDRLTLEFLPGAKPVEVLEVVPSSHALTVYLAGDSTVTDQQKAPWAGWGQVLPRFFRPGVAVANHAESGRALYSFRWELRLEKILSTIRPGDYLLIQFGHNDQKNKADGAGPFTTYKKDLEQYVNAVRARKARPVLVTPMERRRWKGGRPAETLADYAEAVRQVGKEQGVPVLDLHAMSLEPYTALGPEGSKRAFVHYPANSFPGQRDALRDDTHHSSYGAYELARCVVRSVRDRLPDLAKHLREDVGSFDPSTPDAPGSLPLRPDPAGGTKEASDSPR